MTWTSWHLHTASGSIETADRVITEVIVPVVTETAPSAWFFVRYWQRGPHVRLRMRDVPESTVDALTRELAERLAEADEGEPMTADICLAVSASLAETGEGEGPLPLGTLLPPGVHRARYEPEYERYGGAAAMPVSEALFHESSRLAAGALLALRHEPLTARFVTGLAMLLAGLAAVDDDLAALSAEMRDSWAAFGQSVAPALLTDELTTTARAEGRRLAEQPACLPPAFSSWSQSLRQAGLCRPALRSHLHMSCNRLGLGVSGEVYLWTLLAEFFSAQKRGDVVTQRSSR